MMRAILLIVVLFLGFGQKASAFCLKGEPCSDDIQYVAQGANISPEIISNIQAQFNGRVISVQPSSGGNISIQLLTQDNRVVIVTVDSYGSIVGVQE